MDKYARKILRMGQNNYRPPFAEKILQICMYCHKVRDDKGHWLEIECNLTEHTVVHYSHGICPDCYKEYCQMEFG